MPILPVITYDSDPLLGDMVKIFHAFHDDVITGHVIGQVEADVHTASLLGDELLYVIKPSKQDEEACMENFWSYVPAQKIRDGMKLKYGRIEEKSLTVPLSMIRQYYTPYQSQEFQKQGNCPRCGDRGYWKSLALVCPRHGQFV